MKKKGSMKESEMLDSYITLSPSLTATDSCTMGADGIGLCVWRVSKAQFHRQSRKKSEMPSSVLTLCVFLLLVFAL